jgi:hypothetical protein
MAMLMVNGVLALIVSPFLGFVNFADGILVEDGIDPIGAGLHEPAAICFPFVICWLGTVRQKLMKLFFDVSDAT